jgi:hypothetical protein
MPTKAKDTNKLLTKPKGTDKLLTKPKSRDKMLTKPKSRDKLLTKPKSRDKLLTKLKSTNNILKIRRLEKMIERCRQPTDRIAALAGKILKNPNYSIDAKSLAGAILYIRKYLKRDH